MAGIMALAGTTGAGIMALAGIIGIPFGEDQDLVGADTGVLTHGFTVTRVIMAVRMDTMVEEWHIPTQGAARFTLGQV